MQQVPASIALVLAGAAWTCVPMDPDFSATEYRCADGVTCPGDLQCRDQVCVLPRADFEYWIDEGDATQPALRVSDRGQYPIDLDIIFFDGAQTSPAWNEGSGGGRHLRFSGSTHGWVVGGAAEIAAKLSTAQGFSIVSKHRYDDCQESPPLLVISGDGVGSLSLRTNGLDIAEELTASTECTSGTHVVIWVVDPARTPAVRAFIDGQLVSSTVFGDYRERVSDLFSGASGGSVQLGPQPGIGLGSDLMLWYVAVYGWPLTEAEIERTTDELTARDDAITASP